MWCLNCKMQVITEAEYDPTKHQAVGNTEPSPVKEEPKPTPAVEAPQPTAVVVERAKETKPEKEKQSTTITPAEPAPEPKQAPSSSTNSAAVPNLPSLPALAPAAAPAVVRSRSSPAVQNTITALEERLSWATEKLSDPSTSIADVICLSDMIRYVSVALESLIRVSVHYQN
jgi:hypothetical protein